VPLCQYILCWVTIIVLFIHVSSDLSNGLTGYVLSTVFVYMGLATPRLMNVTVVTIVSSGLKRWCLRLSRGCLDEKHFRNRIMCRMIPHTFFAYSIAYTNCPNSPLNWPLFPNFFQNISRYHGHAWSTHIETCWMSSFRSPLSFLLFTPHHTQTHTHTHTQTHVTRNYICGYTDQDSIISTHYYILFYHFNNP